MWNAIYEAIVNINGAINDFVWGVPCLVLLMGTGLYYTIRLGFMQFRHLVFLFKETIVKAFKKKDDASKVKLMQSTGRLYTVYYDIDGYYDYYYGALLRNTSELYLFDVVKYYDGLLLRLPSKTNPSELAELTREGVQEVCGARFTRLAATVQFGDALLEIAFDQIGTKKLMAKTASAHMRKL
mgnify:CR=1 FL=1